jgi:hypothetical protein
MHAAALLLPTDHTACSWILFACMLRITAGGCIQPDSMIQGRREWMHCASSTVLRSKAVPP